MTKARNQFIYKIPGSILSRTPQKAPPSSKYAGQEYYRLRIIQADRSTKSIQVFPNKLTNPAIWKTLKQAQHGELSNKQYLFHCRNTRGHYHLIDWVELPKEETN